MKVLHLDLFYKLPDDFSGSFEDALESYIAYRRAKHYPTNNIRNQDPTRTLTIETMWAEFLYAINNTEYCAVLASSMTELDPVTNTWIDLLDLDT